MGKQGAHLYKEMGASRDAGLFSHGLNKLLIAARAVRGESDPSLFLTGENSSSRFTSMQQVLLRKGNGVKHEGFELPSFDPRRPPSGPMVSMGLSARWYGRAKPWEFRRFMKERSSMCIPVFPPHTGSLLAHPGRPCVYPRSRCIPR